MGNKIGTINDDYVNDIEQLVSEMQKNLQSKTFYASDLQKQLYDMRPTTRLQTLHSTHNELAVAISSKMTRENIVISHRGIKGQTPAPVSIRMSAAADYVHPLPHPPKSYDELYLEAVKPPSETEHRYLSCRSRRR